MRWLAAVLFAVTAAVAQDEPDLLAEVNRLRAQATVLHYDAELELAQTTKLAPRAEPIPVQMATASGRASLLDPGSPKAGLRVVCWPYAQRDVDARGILTATFYGGEPRDPGAELFERSNERRPVPVTVRVEQNTIVVTPQRPLRGKTAHEYRMWAQVGGREWSVSSSFRTGAAGRVREPPKKPSKKAEPLQVRVNRAIDRGVEWLKRRQAEDGSWGRIGSERAYNESDEIYDYPVGPTALALLTLLKCGVPPDDPRVRKGFEFVRARGRVPQSTYEIATLMLAVEARANPRKRDRFRKKRVELSKADRAWMVELASALVERWSRTTEIGGGWRYALGVKVRGGNHDLSNTQFAMLALGVAHRAGVRVPAHIVRGTVYYALEQQEKTGPKHARPAAPKKPGRTDAPLTDQARGWAYIRNSPIAMDKLTSGTMTTGGIVVLAVGRALWSELDPKTLPEYGPEIERGIRDGLAWLDRNWTVHKNPGGTRLYHLLYLYGVERVGDLLKINLIGRHDWYRDGAKRLLALQHDDGRWDQADTHRPHDVLNTCFALLFLDRATVPVTRSR